MRRESEMKGLLFGAAALASVIAGPAYAIPTNCGAGLGSINVIPTIGNSSSCAVTGGAFDVVAAFTIGLAWADFTVNYSSADNPIRLSGLTFSVYSGTATGAHTLLDSHALTNPADYTGGSWSYSFSDSHKSAGDYYVQLTGSASDLRGVSFGMSSYSGAPAPVPGAGVLSLAFFLLAGVMSPTAAPLRRVFKRRLGSI